MPTPMPNRLRTPLTALALFAVAALGCGKEEEVKTLFAEDGAWTLVKYDIEDGTFSDVVENGQDGFMLNFKKSEKVVTAATCGVEPEDVPSNTACNLTPADAPFTCRCFAYAYEDDRMLWREFSPGTLPPKVEFMDDGGADGTMATGSGGGESGGAGGDTMITLGIVADVMDSYTFSPLPFSLFDSNGSTSRFQFEARGSSLFETRVFDGADGNDPCPQRCIPE